MKPLRLVLVTRQFWPLIGGAETISGNLSAAWRAAGHRVTVLTARWNGAWPAHVDREGVDVFRLVQPPIRFWGTWRYMRELARWLRVHRGEYDAVCVSMLKHDAYAVLGAVDLAQMPVVLRPEGTGATGDITWQRSTWYGEVIARRCRQASAVLALAPAARDELLSAGYSSEKIEIVPNGVPIPPPRDAAARQAARADLAQAHPQLALPPDALLAVYVGRLVSGKGLFELIEAWRAVRDRLPEARLWLVGDGPDRDRLARRIGEWHLASHVALAGRFDHLADIYQAADLFVLPSHEELMSIALLEAMAAGLPIVASDIAGNRNVLADSCEGLLVPPRNAEALGEAMTRMLQDRATAEQFGAAARGRAASEFSIERCAARHLEVFERLLAVRH